MKTPACLSRLWNLALSLIPLSGLGPAFAQDADVFPTVTIYATDAHASETGSDPGTFTVKRSGSTNFPLAVFFHLSGTASNGVDYEQLVGSVQIPAGSLDASFIIKPIDDILAEGDEAVVAQLTGSPLACATCGYDIGVPSNAVVVIADNDLPPATNHPPFVRLNAPQDGDVFVAPADIALTAYAQDAEDGDHLQVEFFEGTNSLGFGTFVPTLCPAIFCNFFALAWSNVPPGEYTLTARATDSQGASSNSQPVRVFVVDTNGLKRPVVNIYATDDTGSEIPVVPPWLGLVQRSDPAVFTVTRTGPTNFPLTVFYGVGGTASIGVDYLLDPPASSDGILHGRVTIPVGATSTNIRVWVIDDLFVEGTETVELTLEPPICIQIFPPSPGCYLVGLSDHAAAQLLDNDLTPAPVVTVVATDPDAAESGPNPGTFTVYRTGPTGDALPVFYAIGGTAQIDADYLTLSDSDSFLHAFGLTNVVIPAGASSAEITVMPIEDHLAEGSETVLLHLQQPPWAPYLVGRPSNAVVTIADDEQVGTNLLPSVHFVTPRDGGIFVGPTNLLLGADAFDHDGSVTQVEFFEGDHRLGLASGPLRTPYGTWLLAWSNVAIGHYTLSARATDNLGAVGVSTPVNITVVSPPPPPPPPPTNLPTVVNIVARDPFASEGTNFWQSDWDANRWAIDIWNPWSVNLGGTNTATFIVRRHGLTNDDLTVHYEIGGTASNGADYVALPGSVVVPAGRRTGRIVVVPIEDSLAEGIETVLLSLQPSSDYTVGFPAHAAAIILDRDQARPSCVRLRDGMFHLCQPATNGFCFRVEASADLLHWTALCTNVVTDGALHFVDPDAPPLDAQFYRAEPESGLLPDE